MQQLTKWGCALLVALFAQPVLADDIPKIGMPKEFELLPLGSRATICATLMATSLGDAIKAQAPERQLIGFIGSTLIWAHEVTAAGVSQKELEHWKNMYSDIRQVDNDSMVRQLAYCVQASWSYYDTYSEGDRRKIKGQTLEWLNKLDKPRP